MESVPVWKGNWWAPSLLLTWEHRERMPSGARKQGYWVCLRTMLGSLALGWSQPYQFPRRLSRGTGDVLGSTWVTFPGDGQVQSGQAERPRSVRLPLQHVPFYRPHPTLSSQPLVEAKRCIPFLWRCDKVPGLPRGLHVVEGRAGVCAPALLWRRKKGQVFPGGIAPHDSTPQHLSLSPVHMSPASCLSMSEELLRSLKVDFRRLLRAKYSPTQSLSLLAEQRRAVTLLSGSLRVLLNPAWTHSRYKHNLEEPR